jgi:trimethylamine--corrinoid protein Co-methyltransferase
VVPGLHPAGLAVDAALAAARHGLPVGFALGLTGAAAEEGSQLVARLAASALAACAAVQIAAPGATFIASLPGDALRPPTGGLADAPSAWLLALAYNELMSSFGLPTVISPATTAAAQPGWRSSVETTFATLLTALGSPALLSGAGLLAGGRAFSRAQLVLDCESYAVCARIAQGIEVDEETVAQETIAAIGIGGNALAQRHTRRHIRDVWRPRVFDRGSLEAWQREGRAGSERKADELAARILTEHQVAPLEAEKAATLARIVATSGL